MMYKRANAWAKFTVIASDGWKYEYQEKPFIKEGFWSVSQGRYSSVSSANDASNWENSLIEIDAQEQESTAWNGEGLPPVGIDLDIGKVFSSDGVDEWFCKPMIKVVGHHCDGVRFFVESLKTKSIQVFDCSSENKQYRPIKTEREKFIDKAMDAKKAHQWTDREFLECLYDNGCRFK